MGFDFALGMGNVTDEFAYPYSNCC